MLHRVFSITLLTALVFVCGAATVVRAQGGTARGKVEIKKADGKTVPAVGITVAAYRIDVKTKLSEVQTNDLGEFTVASLVNGGQYALAVTGPGVRPQVVPGVKAGDEKIKIVVDEGEGQAVTEEQVRESIAAMPGPDGKLTEEQKKAQAEREKKNAEIEAKNAKAKVSNEIINRVLKEGNKAYDEKNYDLAVAKYDEGINAEPDFAGSTPVLLNNKSQALLSRAILNFNQAVKNTDAAAKQAGYASVKKDLEEVVTSSDRSLTLLKGAPTTDAAQQKSYDANKATALVNRKEAYRLMSKTGVDRTKGKETLTAFEEYLAVETDAKKKADAQLAVAEALQDSNEFDLAITEFEKILANEPNNADALVGAGLSLVTVGYVTAEKNPVKGKEQFQQAANYLQKFLDTAPDTHKYKADAKSAIETLNSLQNVKPQKVTKGTTTKKKS